MSEHTRPQHWIDSAILLTLWTSAAKKPWENAGDRLRLMKLAFLAAHDLQELRFRALGLSFYRWTWGPLSNEVYSTWEALAASGLMEEEERFVVTDDGAEFAESFGREVIGDEPNACVRQTIDRIAEEWAGRMATKPILDHVYRMKIRPVGGSRQITIKQARRGTPLMEPLQGRELVGSFEISNAWVETLGQYFSPFNDAVLSRAERDFRERRFVVAQPA